MTEIMFETFNVPAMYILHPGRPFLVRRRTATGIVLDSGDKCHPVPNLRGYAPAKRHLAS